LVDTLFASVGIFSYLRLSGSEVNHRT